MKSFGWRGAESSPRNHQYPQPHLNGFVGAGDEGDEEAEDHVDEEADEGVEVDLAEEPDQIAVLLHLGEGDEHIVPVDEGEEALGYHGKGAELGWEVTKGW